MINSSSLELPADLPFAANTNTTPTDQVSPPKTLFAHEARSPSLNDLFAAAPASALVPVTPPAPSAHVPARIDTQPLPPPVPVRKIRRNGRVASLPKIQRDMVNHMLWNGIPYKNIVAALDDAAYTVTERNISNWATGGYLEWSLAQEHVLHNRLNQDQLLDFLRRDDAPELPEIGLQAAATRLSQVLLQKLARADDPEAHLGNFSQLVDLLCRLNRELAATQKQRDDSQRILGREHEPAYVKEVDQLDAIETERFYSNPPADSSLPKPRVPPALPLMPTGPLLAQQAREERDERESERSRQTTAMLKAIRFKAAAASSPPSTRVPSGTAHLPSSPSPEAVR